MRKCVSGLAAGFAMCVVCAGGVQAESVNRVLKDDGPGMAIVPASASGDFAWQGLYVGASLGGGWGSSTQHYDRAGDHGVAELEPAGGLAAVSAGYNWRLGRSIVAGVEADLGIMNVSQGATTVFDGHVWSSNFGPLFGTLRGRAGYLVSEDLLAYATAGLALANIDDTSIGNTPGETAMENGMRAGFAVGFGAEYAMNEAWTLKAEFLHMDFGEVSGQSTNAEDYSFENSVSILRVGANIAF